MNDSPAAAPPEWVAALYDDLLADMLLRRVDTAAEVAFLIRELRIGRGSRVLDQGCGIGSLAIPLARAGMAVTGVDQCGAYIAEACAKAAAVGVDARFETADAGSYQPPAPVDGAFSWWTSWGHAADDAGNLAMLRAVCDALVPGGSFVLDTMNVCGVLHGFRPNVEIRRDVPRRGGTVRLHRASRIDTATGFLHKVWTYHLPGGRTVRRESAMRLYPPWQVADMLREAGFAMVRLLGSLEGEPLEMDSPRLIAVARKA